MKPRNIFIVILLLAFVFESDASLFSILSSLVSFVLQILFLLLGGQTPAIPPTTTTTTTTTTPTTTSTTAEPSTTTTEEPSTTTTEEPSTSTTEEPSTTTTEEPSTSTTEEPSTTTTEEPSTSTTEEPSTTTVPPRDYEVIATLPDLSEIGGQILNCPNDPTKQLYQFKGIPYAENITRFELAQLRGQLQGIHNGTKEGMACPQTFLIYPPSAVPIPASEIDEASCLVLTVTTPLNPETSTEKRPVLMFIHGGIFMAGTSRTDWYDPTKLACQDIVVVQIQYRLGTLGFASDSGGIIPKNLGLKDARLALEWTHNNIEAFNGDADEITLSGHSAGGVLASILYQSATTNHMINKVALMSGNGLNIWSFQPDAPAAFETVLSNSGCTNTISQTPLAQVNCLKTKSSSDLLADNYNILATNDIFGMKVTNGFTVAIVLEPDVPGAIVTKSTYQRLLDGDTPNNYPVMVTMTDEEGETFEPYVIILRFQANANLVPWGIPPTNRSFVGGLIKTYYAGSEAAWFAVSQDKLVKYTGNVLFDNAVNKFIDESVPHLATGTASLYCMQFSYRSTLGIYQSSRGVGHLGDMPYYWGLHALNPNPTSAPPPQAYIVSDQVCKYLANFVKTGNPTPVADPNLVNWPAVSSIANKGCLNIDTTTSIVNNPNGADYAMWNQWYTQYGNAQNVF